MSAFCVLLQLLIFVLSISSWLPWPVQSQNTTIAACNYSQPHVCGNLSVPYPFGMTPECGLPQFRIACKPNASYGAGDLAFLQVGTPSTPELQVLKFHSGNLVVNSTHLKAMPQNCRERPEEYGRVTFDLPMNGSFVLAESNWFVVMGCNSDGMCNASTTRQPSSISCTTSCYNQYDMPFCNTYSCCINALPPGSWSLDFQGRGASYTEFPDVCGFSTVLNPATYLPTQKGIFAAGQYGLSIAFALKSTQNCSVVPHSPDYACHEKGICRDHIYIPGYTCNCSDGYRGDGYKAGLGCKDIDECKEQMHDCDNPPLGECINTDGSYECRCTSGEGSGRLGTCTIPDQNKNVWLPGLLGALAGAVLLALLLLFALLSRRAYRRRKDREDNFKRIGGDQLTSFLFSERELNRATKGFSDDHVLGEGGFGKVYWGKLSNEQGGMKVAIKRAKPKAVEEQVAQIQSFVREILLLSKSGHKNVVRLLGCCVETSVPLLVYEFVENGTLRDYLNPQSWDVFFQGKVVRARSSMMWAWRLHIAVETAEAVGYLHDMSEPVFHLDMKSANILIDAQYNPKVADFGLSCFLTSDATHLTNELPVGTFGYVDPEYYHSLHVTNKCDVYSFGVILLELISGMPASQGPGAVLAHRFRMEVNVSEEIGKHVKELPSFVDGRLGTDSETLGSVHSVAELASRCVALKGSDRPSMQEVVMELRQIQAKMSGQPYVEGRQVTAHADLAKVQELYAVINSDDDEHAAYLFKDYKGIPSDYSSRSFIFTPPHSSSGLSLASNNSRSSSMVQLGQFSNGRY